METAAHECWWGLSKTDIMDFAWDNGAPVETAMNRFDVIRVTNEHLLSHLSPQERSAILHKGLLHFDDMIQFADSVLGIDGAIHTFVHADHDRVYEEKKQCEAHALTRAEFASSWKAYKKAELKAAMEASEAKQNKSKKTSSAGTGSASSGSGGFGEPIRFEVESTIPQKQAKKFIPPNCQIWRGVVQSRWCFHCPPYTRISEPWNRGGEQVALKAILKRGWRQYLELNALDDEDCPILGLFDA